jgi:hypothetical protein
VYIQNTLSEIVPIKLADLVKSGLSKKYGSSELDSYTFGIELEFKPFRSVQELNEDKLTKLLLNNQNFINSYEEWRIEQSKDLNKRWRGDIEKWDDSYGPPAEDDWLDHNPEPEEKNFSNEEEFQESYSVWKDTLSDIRYNNKKYDFYSHTDDYIHILIGNDGWQEYVNEVDVYDYEESMVGSIYNAEKYISEKMNQFVTSDGDATETYWSVGEDGPNVEIRTKHLSQDEFNLVTQICHFVSYEETGGDTSAHVHIGLPKDFDAFDLLAITTLVDENSVKTDVGPERELSSYARLRTSLHAALINLIRKKSKVTKNSVDISNETFLSWISEIDRNNGTNIRSMSANGTIEFRYLSSDIAGTSDVLIKWIKYFLILPKIAKTRNKIVLSGAIEGDVPNIITAVRLPGKIQFIFSGKPVTPNLPSDYIKTHTEIPTSQKVADYKKQKAKA